MNLISRTHIIKSKGWYTLEIPTFRRQKQAVPEALWPANIEYPGKVTISKNSVSEDLTGKTVFWPSYTWVLTQTHIYVYDKMNNKFSMLQQ